MVILAREVEREGVATLDLSARPLDDRGRPSGPEVPVGQDATPNLTYNGAEQIGMAADTRRDRHLIAWSGHEPGMASEACQNPPGPGGLPPAPCRRRDHEIFVRVIGADGRPLGPPRRVSETGPPDRPELEAVTPTVAYDRRSDGFLLVHAATRGEGFRGTLMARRLDPDGAPVEEPRRLALRPGEDSWAPLSRLVAVRGGFLLAFTWGESPRGREGHVAALGRDGRPRRVRALAPGGPGSGGIELAVAAGGREVLAVWSEATSSRFGFRARRVRADGRPATRRVALPYELGYGSVVVAPARRGWRYAVPEKGGCPICVRLVVQRASRDGRPRGAARGASPSDGLATQPLIAPLGGGASVLGWSEPPKQVGSTFTPGGSYLRRVR